jgi:hypothetical protein
MLDVGARIRKNHAPQNAINGNAAEGDRGPAEQRQHDDRRGHDVHTLSAAAVHV